MKECPNCEAKLEGLCDACGRYYVKNEKGNKGKAGDYLIATTGKRVLNSLLDGIFLVLLIVVIYIILGADVIDGPYGDIISYGTVFIYYIGSEFLRSKTPAKFITKTRVINKNGGKPTFLNICGRTLCRYIPFEFVSFFDAYPRGWHDSLSKTYVIDENKPNKK